MSDWNYPVMTAAIVRRNGGPNYIVGDEDHVQHDFANAEGSVKMMYDHVRTHAEHRAETPDFSDQLVTNPRWLSSPSLVSREFLQQEHGTRHNRKVFMHPADEFNQVVPRPFYS